MFVNFLNKFYSVKFWSIFLILILVLRVFALWENNAWFYEYIIFIGTYIWIILAVIWLPVWVKIVSIWLDWYKNLPEKNISESELVELKKNIKLFWLILACILGLTLNFITTVGVIDGNNKWINELQRLYPNCESVGPDLKKSYASDCG